MINIIKIKPRLMEKRITDKMGLKVTWLQTLLQSNLEGSSFVVLVTYLWKKLISLICWN